MSLFFDSIYNDFVSVVSFLSAPFFFEYNDNGSGVKKTILNLTCSVCTPNNASAWPHYCNAPHPPFLSIIYTEEAIQDSRICTKLAFENWCRSVPIDVRIQLKVRRLYGKKLAKVTREILELEPRASILVGSLLELPMTEIFTKEQLEKFCDICDKLEAIVREIDNKAHALFTTGFYTKKRKEYNGSEQDSSEV